MRTIRFRAIDKYGQWAYFGVFSAYADLVDAETLGQFTGLSDKNGKEIYEGDIVRPLSTSANIGVVEYQSLNDNGYPINGYIANAKGDWLNIWPSAEVIGNIYENPELIEKV